MAVILTMSATAPTDGDLDDLARALRGTLTGNALTVALDGAAWRIARLIDLCLAKRPDS